MDSEGRTSVNGFRRQNSESQKSLPGGIDALLLHKNVSLG